MQKSSVREAPNTQMYLISLFVKLYKSSSNLNEQAKLIIHRAQEWSGHWTVNYAGAQRIINILYNALTQKL